MKCASFPAERFDVDDDDDGRWTMGDDGDGWIDGSPDTNGPWTGRRRDGGGLLGYKGKKSGACRCVAANPGGGRAKKTRKRGGQMSKFPFWLACQLASSQKRGARREIGGGQTDQRRPKKKQARVHETRDTSSLLCNMLGHGAFNAIHIIAPLVTSPSPH